MVNRNQTTKEKFDWRASTATLDAGDRVLVKRLKTTGGPEKLQSYWENDFYRVMKKHQNLLVYDVIIDNQLSSKVRTLHRNHLMPCNSLPVPEIGTTTLKKTKEKCNSNLQAKVEDLPDSDDYETTEDDDDRPDLEEGYL